MFTKIFQEKQEFHLPSKQPELVWAISANGKTVVLWNKVGGVTIITSYDKTNEGWIQKQQEFSLPSVQAAFKIHLSEDGNVLIHYSNDRQIITTWQRQHRNANWIQKNQTKYVPNQNPTANNITVTFFKNQIFASHQENLTVVHRTKAYRMVRKQKVLYNDYLTCLCYEYNDDHFIESTDGVIYYWSKTNEGVWDRELPCWYDGEVMPFYSQSQDDELKVFIPGSVWLITYPDRLSQEIKDDRIKQTETQSALNYFFQNQKNQEIGFWFRQNSVQKIFDFETIPIKAASILLSQKGNVFVIQQKREDKIVIQFYEKTQQ